MIAYSVAHLTTIKILNEGKFGLSVVFEQLTLLVVTGDSSSGVRKLWSNMNFVYELQKIITILNRLIGS